MRGSAEESDELPTDACVVERLYAALVEDDADTVASPHVLISRSRTHGFETIRGPYPSRVAALSAAARLVRSAPEGEESCECSIARLLPPL